ncbi:MAG: GNAT family N-acetyltransferase [Saprospiraceae bacterium]
MPILPATLTDIPALLTLVNGAFRGDSARQGWTHESDLLQGELRTDETSLLDLLQQPGGTVLKYCSDTGYMEGCVYLQVKTNELYLGMLTVAPALQGAGIGKLLLAAAETYARQSGCAKIRMRVLSTRHELIAWYERHGYRLTGETEPYAFDHKFGVPTQPLEFVILEKAV